MEDTETDDLNLSEDELQVLREEGMLPNSWEAGKGGPLSAGAEPGAIPVPEGGPLSAGAPDPVTSGMALLKSYDAAAPTMTNPLAQKFHDLAVSWLPTNDDDLKVAKSGAEKAADQLAALREAATTKSSQFPYKEFGASLLAQGYGSFPQQYGKALLSAQEVQRKNLGDAQTLGLDEARATYKRAGDTEDSVYKRMTAAAAMERAAASMQLSSNAMNRVVKSPTSEIGRAVAAMGYDVATPQGQMAARRLWMLQHGTPEQKEALSGTPPTTDPESPEFQAAIAKVFQRKLDKRGLEETRTRQSIAASEASAAASRAKTREIDQNIETSKTELAPDLDVAKSLSVPPVTVNPYAGLSSKAQSQAYAIEQKGVDKDLDTMQKTQDTSSKIAQGAMQMEELLKKGLKTGSQYVGPLSAAKYLNEDLRRFDQIAKEITPNYRGIGSGSTSDYEQRLYAAAAPGIDKPVEVNRQAINSILITDRLSKIKQEALEKYFSANKTGRGFNTYWNQYLNDTFFDAEGNVHFPKTRTGFDDFTTWSGKKFHSGKKSGGGGGDPLGVR